MQDWKQYLLKIREQYYFTNYAAARDFGVPRPTPYSDKTANQLTRAVCDFLKFAGCYCNRINTVGLRRKVGGRDVWTKGSTFKGTADLHCVIAGRHVSLEIKIGADKMSEHQHREKARIEAAGGVYVVVSSMPQFFYWYQNFIKNQTPVNPLQSIYK